MVKGNLIISILIFIFGTLVSVNSYFYGLGQLSNPDAGTFPFGLGILLMLCSACLFISTLKKLKISNGKDIAIWSEVNFTKVSMIIGALVLYILLLEPLGFLACAFLIQFLLFKVAGSRGGLSSVIATSITIAVVYLVFFWALGVYVPLLPDWIN